MPASVFSIRTLHNLPVLQIQGVSQIFYTKDAQNS
jgi:hypothetical protein